MEKNSEEYFQLKISIALRRLLKINKTVKGKGVRSKDIVNSYQKIATNTFTDMAKPTVSKAFGGETKSEMATVALIIHSMGFTMTEFGNIYDNISYEDIQQFKEDIINRKNLRISKTGD